MHPNLRSHLEDHRESRSISKDLHLNLINQDSRNRDEKHPHKLSCHHIDIPAAQVRSKLLPRQLCLLK